MLDDLAFFFVCQEGLLEVQASLLAASLHCLNYPLIAATYGKINKITLEVMEKLGVQCIPIDNNFNPVYLEGNKLIAFNLPCNCKYRVWLDSDMLLTKPFDTKLLTSSDGVFLNSSKYEVISNLDWRKSFEALGIPYQHKFQYVRACLLSVKNTDFHKKWLENCYKLRKLSIHSPRNIDQISLTLTIIESKISNLIYNYRDNPIFAFLDDIYVFDGRPIDIKPFIVLQKNYMYFKKQGKPISDRTNVQSLAYYDEVRSLIYSLLVKCPLIDRIPSWNMFYEIYLKN